MRQSIVVCLGRFGDIINALPIAYDLSLKGPKPKFIVSKEFWTILEGVSYVNPVVWDIPYSSLKIAINRLRDQGHDVYIAQSYKNPDSRRLTDSYQKESWRTAGYLDKFGKIPLVFDKRSMEREAALIAKYNPQDKPLILFSGSGVSSPFSSGPELLVRIKTVFADCEIVDLSTVTCDRIYDLVGLIESANCLVTIDTAHLHLAAATTTPVVALVNNGWYGSVPCCNAKRIFRYASAPVEDIIQAIAETTCLFRSPFTDVYHMAWLHGSDERTERAQISWGAMQRLGMKFVNPYEANVRLASKEINDPRALPYLKDMLEYAMHKSGEDDVIIWANDDIALHHDIYHWAKNSVPSYGAISMRRNEPGHPGRDLFAFTNWWLKKHWKEFPDYIMGASDFDLGLAAMIRNKSQANGFTSTLENMKIDLWPADSEARYALHEPHKGAWVTNRLSEVPSVVHNRKEFMGWAKNYCPTTIFNNDGVLK